MASDATIPTRALIMSVVDADGLLNATPLFEFANSCGFSDEQIRLCLRRLVASGTLEHQTGRGRRAEYRRAVDSDQSILPEVAFLDFALRQDAGIQPWDGTWRIVAFSIPEAQRRRRDELRRRLVFLGGGLLSGGLYVSPNPWEDLVQSAAESLDVGGELTLARASELSVGGVSDPLELAALIWPLDEVRAGYEHFIRSLALRLKALDRRTGRNLSVGRDALLTVTDFSRAITPDPLLPPELLPDNWIGARARRDLIASFKRFDAATEDEHLPDGLGRLLREYIDRC